MRLVCLGIYHQTGLRLTGRWLVSDYPQSLANGLQVVGLPLAYACQWLSLDHQSGLRLTGRWLVSDYPQSLANGLQVVGL